MYQDVVGTESDINEHLPLLRQLAMECEHVTEFGLRWGSGSTVAFLAAQPETLISWDIDPYSVVSQQTANLIALRGRTAFQPRCGDTLKIAPIEPTDLLFIDSLHTFKQLWKELERHVDPNHDAKGCHCPVKRYLCFHDTITFGFQGEDGSEPGLRSAIRHFQKHHAFPLWRLMEDRENNNGLVVLEHV